MVATVCVEEGWGGVGESRAGGIEGMSPLRKQRFREELVSSAGFPPGLVENRVCAVAAAWQTASGERRHTVDMALRDGLLV